MTHTFSYNDTWRPLQSQEYWLLLQLPLPEHKERLENNQYFRKFCCSNPTISHSLSGLSYCCCYGSIRMYCRCEACPFLTARPMSTLLSSTWYQSCSSPSTWSSLESKVHSPYQKFTGACHNSLHGYVNRKRALRFSTSIRNISSPDYMFWIDKRKTRAWKSHYYCRPTMLSV